MFKLNDVYDFLINNKIKETNKINIYDCLNYYESPKIIEQNGIELLLSFGTWIKNKFGLILNLQVLQVV